jgi:hypothetical protein
VRFVLAGFIRTFLSVMLGRGWGRSGSGNPGRGFRNLPFAGIALPALIAGAAVVSELAGVARTR